MDFITGLEGQLTKMRFTSCEDTEPFNPRSGEENQYDVLINPEQIQQKFRTKFDESQAEGSTGTDVRFRVQLPQAFDVELLFDGTGVVANDRIPLTNLLGLNTAEAVEDQISRFKRVVLDYDGTKHSPNLVQIQWGSFLFKGKMKEMTLTYTLFKPDGTPLRAKAKCNFVESLSDALRTAKERAESPDLTHIRVVKEDESLSLMAYRIYNDPGYYIEVAKANKLQSIRRLEVGGRVHFPPVKKSNS